MRYAGDGKCAEEPWPFPVRRLLYLKVVWLWRLAVGVEAGLLSGPLAATTGSLATSGLVGVGAHALGKGAGEGLGVLIACPSFAGGEGFGVHGSGAGAGEGLGVGTACVACTGGSCPIMGLALTLRGLFGDV